MSRQTELSDGIAYTVSPDQAPPAGNRFCLLAGVRLIDEQTGQPPVGAIAVTSAVEHGYSRTAEGGLAGVVGIPRRAFPALATKSYIAEFTVQVDGYVPRAVAITVPIDPTFPQTFTPPPLNDQPLHRVATQYRGRVVQKTGGVSIPKSGASVVVTGVWRTPPPATVSVPPNPPKLVSLKPPLYFDRAAGVAQLQTINLTPVVGQDKSTLDAVAAGTSSLRLSDAIGLNNGDIVLLDPSDPDRAEYLPIATIAGGSSPDQPANVTLAYAPARVHARGAVVRKVTPGAAGPAKLFAQDGWAGDACVFLADVAGLAPSQVVQISGGAIAAEYHAGLTLVAQTDTKGYFRLPPISRLAQVQVTAADLTLTQMRTVQPDYSLTENVLDFSIQ